MTPFILYHSVSARSFRPLWTLEELELPYQLRMMDFPPRVHAKEFLDTNPLGTVPALETEHGLMTESAAMCQYLATKKPGTPLAVQPDAPEFATFLNMLHYGEATLTFPQTLVLRYQHFESPERVQPQIVEDYTRWFLARTRLLNKHLQNGPYVCGNQFTIADISVGFALMLAELLELLDQTSTDVQEYWQRLTQRPAYQRALAAEQNAAQEQGVSALPAPALRPYATS